MFEARIEQPNRLAALRPRPAVAAGTAAEAPVEPRASSLELPASALPLLRPVGQLANTYVIAEGPDGMYLIDQHAAHERVLYERFLAQQRDGVREVQPLLQPQPIELTARQRALLESFGADLEASGLELEPSSVRLRNSAIDPPTPPHRAGECLRELASGRGPGTGMSSTLINRQVERNILHSTTGWGKTRAGMEGRQDGKTEGWKDRRG